MRSIYPWKRWLDGREHLLMPGDDFSVTTESFVATVGTSARRLGRTVSVRKVGGNVIVKAGPEGSRMQ